MMTLFIVILLCIIITFQYFYIRSNKKKVQEISLILDDIADGNLNRRLLANKDTVLSELVYKINEIIIQNKKKLIKANKSEKAHRELITSLSHDIRTPLASLVGYLDVLESNSCTQEEQKKFLLISKNKALSLSEYIQSLFEWLKLESGEWIYNFESENICELTRIILADWVIKLERNKIHFQFYIPEEIVRIVTDKNVFERIMNNLLSNIIKHSRASLVSVNLTYNSSEVLIKIYDNGIGISEEDLLLIFDRLYKCDNSRSENSNGLGLAIVKELLTAIGGTISVKSNFNKGTIFFVKLPYKHK